MIKGNFPCRLQAFEKLLSFLEAKIFSRSKESRVLPPSSDALCCWLNQGAAPGCAPYLSRCLLGEKLRSTSTANIAECGHCRGTYIGTGGKGEEKLRGLRVERRMDLHLPPLFSFSSLSSSSSSYFSHIIVRSSCEKQQYGSICFPEWSDLRKLQYTCHCFAYPTLLYYFHYISLRKKDS